jgi:hypothetical protein
MRWAVNVTCMEEDKKIAYEVLAGNSEGKRPL